MRIKRWLITAFAVFAGTMTSLKWDFSMLSTVKYETNEHRITGEYTNISIVTDTADVAFVISGSADTTVVCYEQDKSKHTVEVADGMLCITLEDTSKWYEHIGINLGAPAITVHIPQGEYGSLTIRSSTGDVSIPRELSFESIDILESTGDVLNCASASGPVKIKANTGDITVEGITANTLALSVSTGKVTVTDAAFDGDVTVTVSTGKAKLSAVQCKNLITTGNTGDISLQDVIAAERFSIKRSTGDVKLDSCDAKEIDIKTDTGHVSGSLLSPKVFITSTSTGDIQVPKTTHGGRCEITTSTGNIRMTVSE